jgi:hypothetical protein
MRGVIVGIVVELLVESEELQEAQFAIMGDSHLTTQRFDGGGDNRMRQEPFRVRSGAACEQQMTARPVHYNDWEVNQVPEPESWTD